MLDLKNKTLEVAIKISIYISIFVILHIFLARNFIFKNLNQAQYEFEQAQKELNQYISLKQAHPNPEKELEEINKEIEEFNKKAASPQESYRAIYEFTKKANELGIEILSRRPLDPANFSNEEVPQGVVKTYMEVVIKASYKAIGDFLKKIEEMSAFFTVESITLEKMEEVEEGGRASSEEGNDVVANLVVSIYTIL